MAAQYAARIEVRSYLHGGPVRHPVRL